MSDQETNLVKSLLRNMAHRCGLDDPEVWAAYRREQRREQGELPSNCGDRVTGRTTRLMLLALVAAEANCHVTVVIPYEGLRNLYNELATKARVTGTRPTFIVRKNEKVYPMPHTNGVVLRDPDCVGE